MQITVDAQGLAAALQNNLAERHSTLNIFEHVLIGADPDVNTEQVSITSCDGARELEVNIEAISIDQPGAITCHAGKLKSALFGLAGPVTLMHAEGEIATLQQGRRRYRLPSLAAQDYPDGPDINQARAINVDPEQLAKAVDRVAYAMAKRDVRYYLNGVHFAGQDVVATDGHRMALVTLAGADLPAMTLSKDGVKQLVAALLMPGARLVCNQDALEVQHHTGRYRSALLDGRYPDYKRLLNVKDKAPRAAIDPVQLLQPLQRLSGFVSVASEAVGVAKSDNGLRLFTGGGAAAESSDDLYTTVHGEWPEVFICRSYLSDMANAIGKPFQWINADPNSHQYFTTDDGDTVDLIMPVRP
ncbi:MAG: hypothetical protein AB9Q19_12645 [Candidatus Reddybacter sp.]